MVFFKPVDCDAIESDTTRFTYEVGGIIILLQSTTLICVLVLIHRAGGCPKNCSRKKKASSDSGSGSGRDRKSVV